MIVAPISELRRIEIFRVHVRPSECFHERVVFMCLGEYDTLQGIMQWTQPIHELPKGGDILTGNQKATEEREKGVAQSSQH